MDLNRTCEEIQRRRDAGDAFTLLDVREPQERAYCAIEGSVHIPMGEIPQRKGELDPEQEIIVYCHHGMRSMQVAGYLKMNGFDNVLNLAGGIDAWSLAVDPNVPRYS